MVEIYSVCMNKGGVGKTTLVTNLAGAIIKNLNKKVLIIDLDGQGNASMAFGIKDPHEEFEFTIYDVLLGRKKPEDILVEVETSKMKFFKKTNPIHILPSNKMMNMFEFDILPNLKKYGNPFLLLKNAVGEFVKQYDYVFIDTPPSLSLVQGNALALADYVIVPFHPEPFSDIGLISVIDIVQEFKENHNPKLEVSGVVRMRMEDGVNVHSDMVKLVNDYCKFKGIKLFDTVIPKTVRFASSTAYEGKPLTLTNKKHQSVELYKELMEEVLEHGKQKNYN